MKRILALLFLGIWAVALAQAPSDQQGSGDEEQAQEQEAAPGKQAADQGVENEGGENEEGENEGEADDEVSDDEAVENGPDAALEGLPPEVETNPIPDPPEQDEFPGADDEFKPGEEISEDYPVPLPSDI